MRVGGGHNGLPSQMGQEQLHASCLDLHQRHQGWRAVRCQERKVAPALLALRRGIQPPHKQESNLTVGFTATTNPLHSGGGGEKQLAPPH